MEDKEKAVQAYIDWICQQPEFEEKFLELWMEYLDTGIIPTIDSRMPFKRPTEPVGAFK